MRILFWRKKKKSKDVETAVQSVDVMVASEVRRYIAWVHPSEVKHVSGVKEEGRIIKWEFEDKPYEAQVQAAPFHSGANLLYFVRGNEPFTFNPFLQTNWDPETLPVFEGIAEQYFRDKGLITSDPVLNQRFKDSHTGYWITNGLYGALGNDESDKDFFEAQKRSIATTIITMLAGIGLWEAVQVLIAGIGNVFEGG